MHPFPRGQGARVRATCSPPGRFLKLIVLSHGVFPAPPIWAWRIVPREVGTYGRFGTKVPARRGRPCACPEAGFLPPYGEFPLPGTCRGNPCGRPRHRPPIAKTWVSHIVPSQTATAQKVGVPFGAIWRHLAGGSRPGLSYPKSGCPIWCFCLAFSHAFLLARRRRFSSLSRLFPDRWFLPGLASFLLAHVAYVFAFDAPALFRLVTAAGLLLVTSPLLARLLRAVPSSLRFPVLVYTAALAGMSGSALASGHVAAAASGVLFLVYDGVLAWNRFVRAFPFARLLVMTTYHLAQLGLVAAPR
ncbi:MAG: hypothetical protein KatS3mg077_2553 [Candidatus Binatia bacterium]|nr:MAG: hypothetical protein KatS3mg077_2553 [Candidatus Binatia bacterium]